MLQGWAGGGAAARGCASTITKNWRSWQLADDVCSNASPTQRAPAEGRRAPRRPIGPPRCPHHSADVLWLAIKRIGAGGAAARARVRSGLCKRC